MKKWFEKHDLFKILGIGILVTVLLTWIIKSGSFNGTEIVVSEITRIGLSDLFTYALVSLYYFAILVSLFLIIGGFYEILSLTSGYQSLMTKLTKLLKGKEIPFVLVTSFVIAAITSISNEFYQLLVFVPFIIALILNLTNDKIVAFATTFGSILIGIIGSTYSPAIIADLNGYLGTTYASQIFIKILLFFVTYILFNFFTIMRIIKNNAKESKSKALGKKETKKVVKINKDVKIWPVVTILSILSIFTILGYISWTDVLGVKIFDTFHTGLMNIGTENVKIVSYILGNVNSFGQWDLYVIQMLMLLASGLLILIYKIDFNEALKSFADGAKKMLKPVLIMLMIYAICILSVSYPVVPTIANAIAGLASKFNVYLTTVVAFIASLFGVEMRYVADSVVGFFASSYGTAASKSVMLVLFQAIHGFVQFFAPTSLFLMIGLSYLDIKYKDWIKYIWMFLAGLFVIIMAILTLITYIL